MICKVCGEDTILKVADDGRGVDFYSCCNEECDEYAELLIETNNGKESIYKMLKLYKNVIQDITNEKDNI